MAAYAALVSLSHILHQILHPPPTYRFIIPREQIESLREKVYFLIDFLETHSSRSSKEVENWEAKITEAAYAAEDIIESDVVSQITEIYARCSEEIENLETAIVATDYANDQILAIVGEKVCTLLCEGIQTVLEKFLTIEKELMKIKDKKGVENLHPKTSTTATSSRPPPSGKITMVGFDNHLMQIMSELATDESNLQIIPIVGMGGIGKTTLATAVYNDPFIIEHFHTRAWVTISQEFIVRDLLLSLLDEINGKDPNRQQSGDDQLGQELYKALFGRKYLVIMDDMWNIEALEKVKMFIPGNDNGSRILVTTRQRNLTVGLESRTPHTMDLLDEGQSWDLLGKMIFAEEDCPVELEEIGKVIAERCRGLPLALVVIGGLLAKSERTREYWKSVEEDITSALYYGNDLMQKIFSLSYIYLPIYLKPCFLYAAMFPEDFEIRVSTLVRLWIAEGLIKPTPGKCLENVARDYVEDLISRNLILVHRRGGSGKVKSCKIHDLIRNLCIIEAEKEKFLVIPKLDNPDISIITARRLGVSHIKWANTEEKFEVMESAKFNRSWLCRAESSGFGWDMIPVKRTSLSPRELMTVNHIIHGFRLLKVVHMLDYTIQIDNLKLCNLRYVVAGEVRSILPIFLHWNLQTVIVSQCSYSSGELDIWQMPQLRHVKIYGRASLRDPPGASATIDDGENVIVLENLRTLGAIKNFKCTEQVVKRIPNLRKLRIYYNFKQPITEFERDELFPLSTPCERVGYYCLRNLACFQKLESLGIGKGERLWTDIAFPISLKKLSLRKCNIPWEDLSIVGSLPNLEVLKLRPRATKGEEWNPVEGEFCRLKFLLIRSCDLKIWRADNSHFPSLERLSLLEIEMLKEIPISFAEILTLEEITLRRVDDSVWDSARKISDERELLGYEPLQILGYR